MARGKKRFRDALALALIAAGDGAAWAMRLDKTACADLNTELSSLLASGLKEDMDKGPAWAAANLSSERLVAINRVIELQGIIEFRCGAPPRAIAKPDAKPEAPAEKPGTAKAATAKSNAEDNEDAAAQKPTQKSKTIRRRRGSAATMPGVPEIAPVANAAAQTPVAAAPALTSAVPPATTATAAMPVKTVSEAPKAPVPEKTAATSAPGARHPRRRPRPTRRRRWRPSPRQRRRRQRLLLRARRRPPPRRSPRGATAPAPTCRPTASIPTACRQATSARRRERWPICRRLASCRLLV